MEIDARDAVPPTIDAIRFAGDRVLTGGPSKDNIRLKLDSDTGNGSLICAKADIPNLIKALQIVIKQW